MSDSILFVRGVKPKTVKFGEVEYQAGKLSYVGLNGATETLEDVRDFLKETYGWDGNSQVKLTRESRAVVKSLLSTASILILAADYTQKLTPADLLTWDADFISKCFETVLELNPRYKVQPDDNGQAQPETHNEDGTPKTQEETPKN